MNGLISGHLATLSAAGGRQADRQRRQEERLVSCMGEVNGLCGLFFLLYNTAPLFHLPHENDITLLLNDAISYIKDKQYNLT
jgi:hypothetical protein